MRAAMTIFKACSIDGCGRNAKGTGAAKGFCQQHYYRFSRYGDPTGGSTSWGEPSRFLQEVALPYKGDDCLAWPFSKAGKGYGSLWHDGKHMNAHRFICELVHGHPPTAEHEAAHNCGNGHLACVNPSHLEWKTKTENEADKVIHGTIGLGERNPQAKLTEAQVIQIHALKGMKSQRALAREFGVQQAAISRIHTGQRWAWLTEGSPQ